MNKKILTIIFGIMLISLASASIEEGINSIDITISNNHSEFNLNFNSSGYDWDEFCIEHEIGKICNLYLSDLLDSINFKIENNNGFQFTEIQIEEHSNLYFLLDNILTYYDYNFSVSDINQNASLMNEFIDLGDYPYQSFEKSGNNFFYSLDSGYDDINIENIITEAVNLFDVSEILPLGIDMFDFDITEILGFDSIVLENGDYELTLAFENGNLKIGLTLEGVEVVEEEEEPEEEEPSSSCGSCGSSRSSSNTKTIYVDTPRYVSVPEYIDKEVVKEVPIEVEESEKFLQKRLNVILIVVSILLIGGIFIIIGIVQRIKIKRLRNEEFN